MKSQPRSKDPTKTKIILNIYYIVHKLLKVSNLKQTNHKSKHKTT